jgi:hypothetical protein
MITNFNYFKKLLLEAEIGEDGKLIDFDIYDKLRYSPCLGGNCGPPIEPITGYVFAEDRFYIEDHELVIEVTGKWKNVYKEENYILNNPVWIQPTDYIFTVLSKNQVNKILKDKEYIFDLTHDYIQSLKGIYRFPEYTHFAEFYLEHLMTISVEGHTLQNKSDYFVIDTNYLTPEYVVEGIKNYYSEIFGPETFQWNSDLYSVFPQYMDSNISPEKLPFRDNIEYDNFSEMRSEYKKSFAEALYRRIPEKKPYPRKFILKQTGKADMVLEY